MDSKVTPVRYLYLFPYSSIYKICTVHMTFSTLPVVSIYYLKETAHNVAAGLLNNILNFGEVLCTLIRISSINGTEPLNFEFSLT